MPSQACRARRRRDHALAVRASLADRPSDQQQEEEYAEPEDSKGPGGNRQLAVRLGLEKHQSQGHTRSVAAQSRCWVARGASTPPLATKIPSLDLSSSGSGHKGAAPSMLKPLRRAAVRVVKPRVSDETWARLRAVDPWHRQSRRGLIAFNKWDKHQYARHYGRHFMDLRRTSFTLLQIGIDGHRREGSGGESLRMWKRLFPKAQIVGLEQDDRPFLNEKRILVYQGSQTDAYLLRSIARKHRNLKIIVDAGSHRPEHIRATFAILFPLLSDGGFYAIEETQTSYWPRFGGSANLKDPATTMSMIKDLLDGLNYEEFGDQKPRCYADSHVVAVHCYHNLVIIEKGVNAEGGHRPRDWATPGVAYDGNS